MSIAINIDYKIEQLFYMSVDSIPRHDNLKISIGCLFIDSGCNHQRKKFNLTFFFQRDRRIRANQCAHATDKNIL